MHPLLEDPWIADRIDRALALYEGRVPPEDLAWMRDQLAEVVASDPQTARLARRARPVDVAESGEIRAQVPASSRVPIARGKVG